MKLNHLFEGNDDYLHAAQLAKTGFWGAQGAGCIPLAQTTGRLLIAHRSGLAHAKKLIATVRRYAGYDAKYLVPEQPDTWGTWGGAIDRGQSPEQAVRLELEEEAGYHGPLHLIPLYVFEKKDGGKVVFRYSNFLAIVADEFTPHLDWENQGFRWIEYGQWPTPMHFGLTALLHDAASVEIIQKYVQQYSGDK